jgi:YhcH/YjgK/YiaL family protein
MVIDTLDNAGLYAGLGPRIAHALAWIRDADLAGLAVGRHEIDGDAVYAIVSEYTTKGPGEGRWEAHRRYLDLQCVAAGREMFGYAPVATLRAGDYIAENDITWLTGDGHVVALEPGRFVIVWPGDAHMPGMAEGAPAAVKKVVVKIAV